MYKRIYINNEKYDDKCGEMSRIYSMVTLTMYCNKNT